MPLASEKMARDSKRRSSGDKWRKLDLSFWFLKQFVAVWGLTVHYSTLQEATYDVNSIFTLQIVFKLSKQCHSIQFASPLQRLSCKQTI